MAPTATPTATLAAQPPPVAPPAAPPADQDTVAGMAQRIRAKYPGAYDDKTDIDLVDRVIQKYPVYRERLSDQEYAKLPSSPANQQQMQRQNAVIDAGQPENREGFFKGALHEFFNQARGATQSARPFSAPSPGAGAEQGANLVGNWELRKQQGYPLRYRLMTAATEALGIPTGAEGEEQAAKRGDMAGVIGHAAVPGAELLEGTTGAGRKRLGKTVNWVAQKTAPLRQSTAEAITRPTIQRPLRKLQIEERYGHEPEKAIVSEKVSTSAEAQKRLNDLGQAIDDELTKPAPAGQSTAPIDTEQIIRSAADAAIQKAMQTGKPAAVSAIESSRDALLQSHGNLQKAPRAAAQMYRTIREGVKYGPDDTQNIAANYRQSVADAISNSVKNSRPDAAPLMQRYGDLKAAAEDMKRGEDTRSMQGMFSRAREGVQVQGTRKAAQAIGTQYPALPGRPLPRTVAPQMPAPPAGPGLPPATPTGAALVPGGPALPPATNVFVHPQPTPTAPPAPAGLAARSAPTQLPGAFGLRGTELQSSIGPESSRPLRMPAGQAVPEEGFRTEHGPSGEPIASGPSTPKPPARPFSRSAAAAADPRTELSEVVARQRKVDQQVRSARAGTQAMKEAIQKARELSARREELEKTLGITKPEAKPFTARTETTAKAGMKPEAKPLTKLSFTPTFDSLPKEAQEHLSNVEKRIQSMPQSLRQAEEAKIQKYAPRGFGMKERLAREYAKQNSLPVKFGPGEL